MTPPSSPLPFAAATRSASPAAPKPCLVAFVPVGDIRFFHQAALAGDATLDTFFTDEYTLNHLIHNYPKPYLAFMDGIVMGGGMGISQGASLRIVYRNHQNGHARNGHRPVPPMRVAAIS